MKFNKLFGIFSSLLISLFSYHSNQNLNFNYLNCGECFDCIDHEHSHNHKIEELIVGNDLNTNAIYDIPSAIIFATSTLNSMENYGEVIIQANYEPEGCLADSIWESSDETKITVTPDDSDSSICKLTCIAPFDDEVTITVKSLYFPSLSHSIKVTYDSGIVIEKLVNSVSLSGVYNYNCDGSSLTLGNEFDKELLSNIFRVSNSEKVSYIIQSGSNYASVNDNYLVQTSRSSYSSGVVRCYETAKPTNYVDVSFSTSSTTNRRSHNYIITDYATCTFDGEKECSNCGDIITITATGHNYGSYTSWSEYEPFDSLLNEEATCTEDGKQGFKRERYRTCYTCGSKDWDIDTKYEVVEATGHSYDGYSSGCTLSTYTCKNGCGNTEKRYKYSSHGTTTSSNNYVCNDCGRTMTGTSCTNINCSQITLKYKWYVVKTCSRCSVNTETTYKGLYNQS